MFGELELFHHGPAGVRAYTIDPVASGGDFHLRYDGAVGLTLSDEPQLLAVNLVRSNGSQALTGHTNWSTCSPSLTCPQWRNNLSTLDTRSFPSLGWRISSLAISTQWPTLRSCAFRWTPCSTTADLPAFPLAHLRSPRSLPLRLHLSQLRPLRPRPRLPCLRV